jgi:protein TonB
LLSDFTEEPPGKARWVGLKVFLCLSLALHLAVFVLIYKLPAKKERRPEGPYVVRIIKMPRVEPAPAPALPRRPEPVRPEEERAPLEMTAPGKPVEKPAGTVKEEARVKGLPRGVAPPGEAVEKPAGEAEGPPSEVAGLPRDFISPREMLLDREVIDELSRARKPRDEDKQDKEKKKGSITFDTEEFRYKGYLERLREHIEYIWEYPSEAARNKIYGDLYITFVIKKDGSLGSVKLERTSGHGMLDEAAMKALREAEPFWPLPGDWEQESLTIKGHFIYSLYGFYVR